MKSFCLRKTAQIIKERANAQGGARLETGFRHLAHRLPIEVSYGFCFTRTGKRKNEVLKSDDFFPAINTADFREQMRVDGTVTPHRLINSLKNAIIETNRELLEWKTKEIGLGYQSLESVPANKIHEGESSESELVYLYRRAVCSAKANITERYR
ncbi:phage head completion protein (GPL), partial [Providencia rustigianii DSM 4541]